MCVNQEYLFLYNYARTDEPLMQELMVENASVRESLYNMQKQLLSLLSEQPAVLQPESVVHVL